MLRCLLRLWLLSPQNFLAIVVPREVIEVCLIFVIRKKKNSRSYAATHPSGFLLQLSLKQELSLRRAGGERKKKKREALPAI